MRLQIEFDSIVEKLRRRTVSGKKKKKSAHRYEFRTWIRFVRVTTTDILNNVSDISFDIEREDLKV